VIDRLRELFRKYVDRVNNLSLRERGIIFVAILVVLYGIAANLLFPPLYAEQSRIQKQLTSKRSQIQAFEQQIQTALTRAAHDPDAANRAKREQLEARHKELDASLAAVTSHLVSPKEMARMVEQILLKNRSLEVVRIESLAPVPLRQADGAAIPSTGLDAYRHGMRIEIRGNYLDVLRYLKELEALPWKMFWGHINLKVEQYPTSHVALEVYTLSTEQGWITL